MEYRFTDDNFAAEVLQSELPVLVDFFAVWCGPCKMMSPILAEIAEEYDGKLKVGKIDIDENPAAVVGYKISAVPTMILFKNGEAVKQIRGYMPKEDLIAQLGEL